MKVVINDDNINNYDQPTYILKLHNNSKLLSENKNYKLKILQDWYKFIDNKKNTNCLILLKTTDKFLINQVKTKYISTP